VKNYYGLPISQSLHQINLSSKERIICIKHKNDGDVPYSMLEE
jgi:hypothetical protein